MKRLYPVPSRIVGLVAVFAMVFSMFPVSAFSDGISHHIGVTSDVHGVTANIATWLSRNGSDLEYMVFGGDNSAMYWEPSTIAATKTVLENSYPSITPIITMGNHDWMSGSQSAFEAAAGNTRTGVQNDPSEDGYTIYTLGASSDAYQSFNFPEGDRAALEAALESADPDRPFFVVSHYPLHYGENRQGTGVSALINTLNDHPNVFFFWGHNHHGDPQMGGIKVAGDTIVPADATSSSVTLQFTYCNSGCMSEGTGVRVTIADSSESTDITLEFRNSSGTITATETITLDEDSEGSHEPGGENGGGDGGPTGLAYELDTTPDSGSKYVIVARISAGDYALTTESMTSGQATFLVGKPVTVVGDRLTSGVTEAMVWDFVLDTATAFDIMSGTQYLNRQAYADGSSSGLYLGAEAAVGYSDWTYDGTTHNLSTHSTNGDVDFYMRAVVGGTQTYFRNDYVSQSGEITAPPDCIYLYKVVEGDPQEEQPIYSVAITGITPPVAGAIPDTTVDADPNCIVENVSWNPADPTFDYNKQYTVSVTLRAQDGYRFESDVTATVNGHSATSVNLVGDVLTVSYAFGLTEPVTLQSITATFDQGSTTVYAGANLDSLRPMLTVTGINNDGSSAGEIVDYALDGVLAPGESVITVTYMDMTATFTVEVTEATVALRIDPAYAEVVVGRETVVRVKLDHANSIKGVDVVLSYDPDILSVVNVEAVSINELVAQCDWSDPGTIYFAACNSEASDFDDAVVLRITLQGLADGASAITFANHQLTDRDATLVPNTAVPGNLTVISGGTLHGFIFLEGRQDHSGALVAVQGTQYSTTTAANGEFTLTGIPEGDVVLGHQQEQVPGRENNGYSDGGRDS